MSEKEFTFNREQQVEEFRNASSLSANSFDLAMEDTRRNVDIFDSYKGVKLTNDRI
jgi:hypothetical protein